MSNKIYILFQGFGQTINDWNNKPTKFLSKLKKKGKVFIYKNKWIEQHNDYKLSYLTMDGFIDDVYNNLIKQIPNAHNFRWIPVGESFGGCLALVFSVLFRKKCSCCVLLDNAPILTLKNNKKRIKMTKKMLGHKFKNLTEKKFTSIKQTNPDYLLDYGVISFTEYIQKNIIGKNFNIPIYGFYNISFPDIFSKEFNIYDNIELFDEINKLKTVKNFHYNLFINAGHLIYLDKKAVSVILSKI